jgi:hypothetical protein
METFRPRDRRFLAISVPVFIAMVVLATVMSILFEKGPSVAFEVIVLWILAIVFSYYTVAISRSFTEVRADGIRIRRRGLRRDLAWTDVASITDVWSEGRNRAVWRILVTTSGGEKITLAAPADVEENFRPQFQRIVARWKAATGAS